MQIELVSKDVRWYGDNGVVMVVKVRATPHPVDSVLMPLDVKISGLGEVIVSYGDHFIPDGYNGILEQWLDTTGLLSEWGREAAKYIRTISRVDLPTNPYSGSGRVGYLEYGLKMEGSKLAIDLGIEVDDEKAVITVDLADNDNQRVELGKITITGPVSTDSVKVAVSRVLDSMWGLLDLPLEGN